MARDTSKSQQAFDRAGKVLVGGVNSPVRAFSAVGGNPPVIASGSGSKIFDVDGNEYIDYVCSYGPLILGHAPQQVVTAIHKAVLNGTTYGASTELEVMLAEKIISAIPRAEKIRFTSSGTEAAMTAVRLARGVTGRNVIVKFAGCYHGHADSLLVQAGSGATTLGVPSSPGVPQGATADTAVLDFNDVAGLEEYFAKHGKKTAGVLIEPVAGNMGVVLPGADFLQTLRRLCDRYGAMLIMDEVMTGFRLAWGGAQQVFCVQGDITVLGKIIGGGMPVGAVAASGDIMDKLAPAGGIYQAGTLSGNSAAMAAGLATLETIENDRDFYAKLEATSQKLEDEFRDAADETGMSGKIQINRVGSMLCVFFSESPVTDYKTATACDTKAFARYFGKMLENGVFLPPSQFEAIFVSSAHTDEDIMNTAVAARKAMDNTYRQ